MKYGSTLACLVLLVLVGCGGPETDTSAPKTAGEIVNSLKSAGLPITEVKEYTADDDPNELIGRPNQYTSKASFHDNRLDKPVNPAKEINVTNGGGVEVFLTEEDATRRRGYIEGLFKSAPILGVEYITQRGTALLRVSSGLTPAQAKGYQQAFDRISLP